MRGISLTVAILAVLCAAPHGVGAAARSTPPPKVSQVLDDYFSPFNIGVRSGGSVRWVWPARNLHPHNVKLFQGPAGVSKKEYRSPVKVRRFSFQRAFTRPGIYKFVCTLHPFTMRQLVKVRR